MNFKRVCKSALCLLVACFLVFNIVSIPARATGMGALAGIEAIGTVLGPVGMVAAASVIALGVYAGANPDDFDAIVDGVSAGFSQIGSNLQDGFVEMLQVTDSQGYKQLYVAGEWLENVRSYLFNDSGAIYVSSSYNSTYYGGACSSYGQALTYAYNCPRAYQGYNSKNELCIIVTSDSSRVTLESGTLVIDGRYVNHSFYNGGSSWSICGSNISYYYSNVVQLATSPLLYTDQDLTLGCISASSVSSDVSFYDSTWNSNQLRVGLENPDGSDPDYKVYYPISLPSTYEELHTVTQTDILSGSVLGTPDLGDEEEYKIKELPQIGGYQGVLITPSDVESGSGTGTGTIPGTGTGTESGAGTGVVNLPGWLQDGINNLKSGLLDILNAILFLPAAIASAIWEALPAWLKDGILNMVSGLSSILDAIVALPAAIAEAIAAIFVPSADYVTEKVDALRGEFGFIDSVISTGEFIRDSVSGASGPTAIYVDLGNASSGNYGSQRVLLTDFSWYVPYKSQVDTVLSAALWAFFGWRVFLNLPSIIGGEGGIVADVAFYESDGYYGGRAKQIRAGRSKGKGGKQ